jgi:hypothetical protein
MKHPYPLVKMSDFHDPWFNDGVQLLEHFKFNQQKNIENDRQRIEKIYRTTREKIMFIYSK